MVRRGNARTPVIDCRYMEAPWSEFRTRAGVAPGHHLFLLLKETEVGCISPRQLRDYCRAHELDSQIIYQLFRDGYLKVLS